MNVVIDGVTFAFKRFVFRMDMYFLCFLWQVDVTETKSKLSWRAAATYHSLVSCGKAPGQFILQVNLSPTKYILVIFSKRWPFITTEVSDVGNDVEVELE